MWLRRALGLSPLRAVTGGGPGHEDDCAPVPDVRAPSPRFLGKSPLLPGAGGGGGAGPWLGFMCSSLLLSPSPYFGGSRTLLNASCF